MTIAEQLIKEGMNKGMAKGIMEGKRKIALNLLRLGYLTDHIVEATGLSIEELMELKKEIENWCTVNRFSLNCVKIFKA